MTKQEYSGGKIFNIFNCSFLVATAVLCLMPIINVLALSFSSSAAATAGMVKLWPVDFNLKSYEFSLGKPEFVGSFLISIKRVLLGTVINMLLTILAAYPLSKNQREFPMRTFYAWFFFITILFGGGLIPWYMTVKSLGLLDKGDCRRKCWRQLL